MVPSSACEGQLYRRAGVPSVVTCFWRVPSGLVSQMLWLLTYAMLLAVAVGVLGQVEVWAGTVSGPPGVAASLAILAAAPLASRRRWPAAAALAPAIALAGGAIAGVGNESLALLVAAVVGTYSAAAYCDLRRAALVLAAVAAGAATSVLAGDGGAADLLFAAFVVAAPWGAGRLVQRLGLHAREVERRAREHQQRLRQATAAERARIARELHDIVAHSVTVMVAQAGGAEEIVESSPQQAREAMRSVRETGQQALVELRRMVGLLRTGDARPGSTHNRVSPTSDSSSRRRTTQGSPST